MATHSWSIGSGFMLVCRREVHGSGFSVRSILWKGPGRSAVDMVNVGGTLAEAGFASGLAPPSAYMYTFIYRLFLLFRYCLSL